MQPLNQVNNINLTLAMFHVHFCSTLNKYWEEVMKLQISLFPSKPFPTPFFAALITYFSFNQFLKLEPPNALKNPHLFSRATMRILMFWDIYKFVVSFLKILLCTNHWGCYYIHSLWLAFPRFIPIPRSCNFPQNLKEICFDINMICNYSWYSTRTIHHNKYYNVVQPFTMYYCIWEYKPLILLV